MSCKHNTTECECVVEIPHASWYEAATKITGHWPQVWCVLEHNDALQSKVIYVASTEEQAKEVMKQQDQDMGYWYSINDLTIDCSPAISNWL